MLTEQVQTHPSLSIKFKMKMGFEVVDFEYCVEMIGVP